MNTILRSKRISPRLGLLCSLFFLIVLVPSLSNVEAAPAGFVTTCGSSFCLNGQTFNVAGTNNHYLGWGTQYEVDQVLNDARAMNLNVVRGIMHSVRGSLDGTQVNQGTMPLKWNWSSTAESSNMGMNGVYILYWDTNTNGMAWNDSTETGLGRWDYVIWKAKQLGLKLDIALLDFWQWAGGVQQINANFKGGNYDMSNAPDRYTFFFSDSRTKQFYKNWVNHVLNRTNTLTGVKYKDDPTIFAWDLMNEPEIAGTTLGKAWISEMAAYIKSIDSNHMVASGNEGFTDGHAGSNPQLEMGISTIDFATWHTYPTYHNLTTNDVTTLINTHCQTAHSGGKPVLLQEFAYPSNRSDQATVYQNWVNVIYNNPNCAGWMFWRLEGLQASGRYPADNGEGFGVYNNNSAVSKVFKDAAIRLIARSGTSSPTATPQQPTNVPTGTPPPTSTPKATVTPTSTPKSSTGETFWRGINFNGNAVTIQGRNWLGYNDALSQGLSVSGTLPDIKNLIPSPGADTSTAHMLNTLLYAQSEYSNIQIGQRVPNGTYHIYIWTMENWASYSRRWNMSAEGIQVATGLGNLPLNTWQRYGPYTVTIKDQILNLQLTATAGRAMIMGMEIYTFN